jgi:transketolase
MVGMHSFGASAPWKDLQKHFGFTPDVVASAAKKAIAAAKQTGPG